jgi:hypothetical protein
METTDFADILTEAAAEVTALDPDNLAVEEFRYIRRAAKKRLEVCWEYHYWPDLDRMEQRFYRADWDAGTAYGAGLIGAEVYYPPTQKYYQALQNSTNQAPADSLGNTNMAYWALSARFYAASQWSAAVQYAQGQMVQYGDNVYMAFTSAPPIGNLPTDTTNWGILQPFDQYIAYEQTGKTPFTVVNAAWNVNPRTSTRGRELNWSLSEHGLQISSNIAFAWVDYRIRCPKLSGENFDATVAYPANAQIYFSSATTPGNFYTNVLGGPTTPGWSPENTLVWDLVQIPRIFHKYLVHSVAADWIRGPGGGAPEDAQTQLAVAEQALEDMKTLLVMQQSQHVRTVVQTR